MSIQTFLTNENMKLLWDVLMDNEIFQNKPREFLLKINTLFNQNISDFYEKEKTNFSSLLELNKKFIIGIEPKDDGYLLLLGDIEK